MATDDEEKNGARILLFMDLESRNAVMDLARRVDANAVYVYLYKAINDKFAEMAIPRFEFPKQDWCKCPEINAKFLPGTELVKLRLEPQVWAVINSVADRCDLSDSAFVMSALRQLAAIPSGLAPD